MEGVCGRRDGREGTQSIEDAAPARGHDPRSGVTASPAITPQHRTQDAASAGLTTPGEAAETWVGTTCLGHVSNSGPSAVSSLHGDTGGWFSQGPRNRRHGTDGEAGTCPLWETNPDSVSPRMWSSAFLSRFWERMDPLSPRLSPSTEEICSKDTNNVKERIWRADHMSNLVYRFLSAISN